jgi:hypothetical protein
MLIFVFGGSPDFVSVFDIRAYNNGTDKRFRVSGICPDCRGEKEQDASADCILCIGNIATDSRRVVDEGTAAYSARAGRDRVATTEAIGSFATEERVVTL